MSTAELLGRLIGVFFPIFAIVGVGFWYGRKHKPELAAANRVNMDIFIPAVVFAAMAGKSFDVQIYLPLAVAVFLLLAICGVLAWGVAHLTGVPAKTLVPPMMFNNSGNIGLPLAMLAWGEAAMPAAVIMFVVENIFHFTFGARLLDPKARVLTLWRMPVVFASFAGVAVALLKIELWQPALTAIKMLGDISIPLMLFSLGVRMTEVSGKEWQLAVATAVVRPLLGVGLAFGLIQVFALSGRDAAMLLVFGALPPAVLNFMFAERYNQEPQRVASIVLIGNMAALICLPLALAYVL